MNFMARNIWCATSIVRNVLNKNGGSSLVVATRNAAFKSDLKIKWNRPPKIASTMPEKSGDGGIELNLTPQTFVNGFDKSKELEDADDLVKKMFTLEFMPLRETRNKKREATLALVQRHKADRGSMESKLAAMTSEVLHLQEHMVRLRKDKVTKHFLKELIERRKKFLKKLRIWDYKRFEWLLEKLNLVFKPNTILSYKVTRKRSMKKLTKMHCMMLKRRKLQAYKEELNAQKEPFYKEKYEKLKFIREEELACGREPTVTEEEIAEALEVAKNYRIPTRRRGNRENTNP